MQKQPQFLQRDGTSQAGRIQKALEPAYVSVDERTTEDLLAFARKYAQELRYFNEQNEPQGDWQEFLGDNNFDEIAKYLKDPERFHEKAKKSQQFLQPHVTLFLTFLELIKYARLQLNDLTRRHLEFYYREALQLTSRSGMPDQVHALVELADGQEQFLLPAGSRLHAGQDSQGSDLFYRTDEDLVANRATVASVKSLFVEKKIIGIREARLTPDVLIELFPTNKEALKDVTPDDLPFMAMLMMALGSPVPGGELDPYPAWNPTVKAVTPGMIAAVLHAIGQGAPLSAEKLEPSPGNRSVNTALLKELDTLLDFIPSVLYMPFSTFRAVMQLKNEQAVAYSQWDTVNDILQSAARSRLNNHQFTLDRSEPANFEKNLLAALGRTAASGPTAFGDFFNELPEVEDIYDLYRRRDRADIIAFIGTALYLSVEDFSVMMEIVEEINGRWRQIYEILRAAGRKKQRTHPEHVLQSPFIRAYEPDKFSALVQKTLGTIDYSSILGARPASFDDCYAMIGQLENYFHVPAEKFVFIRAISAQPEDADVKPWEWDQVYAILEDAHSQKELVDRQKALQEKREKDGFQAMILFALGDPDPGNDLPDSRNFAELKLPNDQTYIKDKLFLEPLSFTRIQETLAKGKAATDTDWARVYITLELAQRRKRKCEDSRAEVEKWENVYIAADATQVQVHLDGEGESVTPRWRTFGEGHPPKDAQARSVPGSIGFAIASPLLALAEGKRIITLTLAFAEEHFDAAAVNLAIQDPAPFQFLLSTEKGMVAIEDVRIQLRDAPAFSIPYTDRPYGHALQITLSLDEQAPAVTPLLDGTGIQTAWPVLQMMLADLPDEDEHDVTGLVKHYRAFQSLVLERVHLRVSVDGIVNLTVQNDDSLLDSKKPFEPFGTAPVTGSSFYLAHPELCSKQLDGLNLSIDWLNAPDNMNTYYLGYLQSDDQTVDPKDNLATSPIADNTAFKARLKLYDNRSLFDVGDIQLFFATSGKPKEGAGKTNQASVSREIILGGYRAYKRDTHVRTAEAVVDWSRYWKLELSTTDFQHPVYPRVAAGNANKVVNPGPDQKPKPYIVNPPYTPKIKRLSVGYSASLEIDLTKSSPGLDVDKLYYIESSGYRAVTGAALQPYSFLPQYENEGELFIGIKNLVAPQNLSLLFQMAEGSADSRLDREPVHWSYLNGNQWYSLEEGRLLSDSTHGLLNSGIVEFDLSAVEPGTLLPADLYWMRAVIAKNSRSVADMVSIQAQALSATFEDHGNAPDHLAQPLPAGSISGLAEIRPEVRAIHQPYSSFGGKIPEQTGNFYTRASERLRHKNRALSCWDYEHMVLEAFPGIYKVKCLPVGASEDPRLADTVQVVVIPNIQGKLPFDPFEPRLPADVLLQIEQYLLKHSPPFARLKVKNPTYVRLKARLGVRLRSGDNPGYYKNALNEELQRYLAPWAYDQSAEIIFDGKINTSLIVNFVEERPYVDYVAGIKLFTSLDGQHFTMYGDSTDSDLEEISVFDPDAILVSDRSHQIDLITEEGYEQEYFTGINYMKIELDFQVTAGPQN